MFVEALISQQVASAISCVGQWLHIYFNQLCWNKSKSAKKKKYENNKKRQVLFLKGKRNSNNGTKLILSLKLFLITILKECLCWLVKSTDCCHYFLTEQQTHTWTLLPTAVTSNTSAREYCFFLILFCFLFFLSLTAARYRFCLICHSPAPLQAILPHKVAWLFF